MNHPKQNDGITRTFEKLNKTIGKLPRFYDILARFMNNYYWKTVGNETRLQFLVAAYIAAKYPDALFMHAVNEGKRSKWEQYVAVYSGMKSGMPDIMIFDPTTDPEVRRYNGLAIELKIDKNKPSAVQLACMESLKVCGWMVSVSYSFEDTKRRIDEYMEKTDYYND